MDEFQGRCTSFSRMTQSTLMRRGGDVMNGVGMKKNAKVFSIGENRYYAHSMSVEAVCLHNACKYSREKLFKIPQTPSSSDHHHRLYTKSITTGTLPSLQHVSKFICISWLLPRRNQALFFDGRAVCLSLLLGFVHFAILALQVEAEQHGQHGHTEHGDSASSHAVGIKRRIAIGIETRADKWSALANDLHKGEAAALTALAGLVVDVPGDDEGDDVEEADGGGVDCEVADKRGDVEDVG